MKKIILLLFITLLSCSTTFAFTDVNESFWAYDAINELSNMKILNGYEDGSFKPNNPITRAEAIKILISTFCPNQSKYGSSLDRFDDVSDVDWIHPYLYNAGYYGNLCGVSDIGTLFLEPDKEITRGEFCVSLSRGAFDNKYDIFRMDFEPLIFSDVITSETSDLFSSIKLLTSINLINGFEDNTFRPDATLTRAQICTIIYKTINYMRNEAIKSCQENKFEWALFNPETYCLQDDFVNVLIKNNNNELLAYFGDNKVEFSDFNYKLIYTNLAKYELLHNGSFVTYSPDTITNVYRQEIEIGGTTQKIIWFTGQPTNVKNDSQEKLSIFTDEIYNSTHKFAPIEILDEDSYLSTYILNLDEVIAFLNNYTSFNWTYKKIDERRIELYKDNDLYYTHYLNYNERSLGIDANCVDSHIISFIINDLYQKGLFAGPKNI